MREQEVHIERPNGSRGIALVNIEAIKDSGGNIVGAVNCFQDVTERKQLCSGDILISIVRRPECP